MTSPELAHRAEQALLGAMLIRPGRPDGAAQLRPADFADPRHQAVFAAITGQGVSGGPFGWLRGWFTRVFSQQARWTAAYLQQLPGLCPDPDHLASYAEIVADAADQRMRAARSWQQPAQGAWPAWQPGQGASPDTQLAGAGSWLAGAARGRGAQPPPWPAAGPAAAANGTAARGQRLPPGVARIARAMQPAVRSLTRQAQNGPAPVPPGPPASRPPGAAGPQPAPGADPGDGRAVREARLSSEWLQELVLADLMHHPGDGRALVASLPAGVFTGPHRDLYELISRRITSQAPIDPLIVARDADEYAPPAPGTTLGFLAQMALHVGDHVTPRQTAAVVWQMLLAEQTCVAWLGPDWVTSPRLTVPGAVARHGDQASHNGQDPARRAAQNPAPNASPQSAQAAAASAPVFNVMSPAPGRPAPARFRPPTAGPARQAPPGPATRPGQSQVPLRRPPEPGAGGPVQHP